MGIVFSKHSSHGTSPVHISGGIKDRRYISRRNKLFLVSLGYTIKNPIKKSIKTKNA